MRKNKVIIVEDHYGPARGLARLIDDTPDMVVEAIATAVDEAVSVIVELKPACVVLDYRLANDTGLEVVLGVREYLQNPRFVVYTGHDEPHIIDKMFQAGVHGYVLKQDQDIETLFTAMRKAINDERYATPDVIKTHLEWVAKLGETGHCIGGASRLSMFSTRELEVFVSLSRGLSVKDIAEKMALRKTTVRTYIRRVSEKIGVSNINELQRFAYLYADREDQKSLYET